MNNQETIGVELSLAYENEDSDFYYENLPASTVNNANKLLVSVNEWLARNIDKNNQDIKGRTFLSVVAYPEDELSEPEIRLQGYFDIFEDSVSALQE